MRGHIIKRYRNSYTIVLNLGRDPATGKRKQQWVSVKGTKKEAEKRLAELLHQLDNGALMKLGKTLVGEFLERWLREYARPNLSPRTVEGYTTIVYRHLIPQLGNIVLNQLRPEHIQKYYAETLQHGRCDGKGVLDSRTVRHHHMVLHRALEVGMKWGLIQRNPADAIDPPKAQRHEISIMDEEDINKLLEAAASTPYYSLFYLDLFTGMRRSEILALRWSDVDLLLGQVSVSRTLHQLHDGSLVFGRPKTARGQRTIALPPSAVIVLKQCYDAQKASYAMLGKQLRDSDLIFSQPDGSPLLPGTITQAWRRLVRRIGLSGVRFHDVRHSHASLLLKQGVHPKIVQERLGHASIQTTLDIYSHVAPGLQEAAAKLFDDNLLPKLKNGVIEKVG